MENSLEIELEGEMLMVGDLIFGNFTWSKDFVNERD